MSGRAQGAGRDGPKPHSGLAVRPSIPRRGYKWSDPGSGARLPPADRMRENNPIRCERIGFSDSCHRRPMPQNVDMPTDYQRPESYPVYIATRQVPLDGSREPVLVGLKLTGLDVHFPDAQILHFDLTGRLLRVAQPNVQWRRGLSGRMLELRRRSLEQGGGLERRRLSSSEIDGWIDDAAAHAASGRLAVSGSIGIGAACCP